MIGSMTRRPLLPSLFSLLPLLSACASAQSESTSLAIDSKLPGAYASVGSIVELSDGRVVFPDSRGRKLHLGDFAKNSVSVLGAAVDTVTATTPDSAYKLPGWVARMAGDTVAVVDFAATRTTKWTPGGFAGVATFPDAGGVTPVLAYDSKGHGYKADFRNVLGGAEPGTTMFSDSMVVLRLDVDGTRADTVARLSPPSFGEATFGESKQRVALVFGPNDAFGAMPDGSVWVARARTHSVDWRSPEGTWTRGPAHRWKPVPVTEADRALVMERLKARGLPQGIEVVFPFAETKPSFEQAMGRPNGEVWLQYSPAGEQEPIRYAVFGRDGKFMHDTTLPQGVRLVGFGAGNFAYGVGINPDGTREVVRLK